MYVGYAATQYEAALPKPKYFALRKSGRCATNMVIGGYAECNRAAKFLRLKDTISQNDNQPNGVTYDPVGCYFEGNVLKFNDGAKNKGACTTSDQCLCYSNGVCVCVRACARACEQKFALSFLNEWWCMYDEVHCVDVFVVNVANRVRCFVVRMC